MNKKYSSLMIVVLVLTGILSGLTAFAELTDTPASAPVDLTNYFTNDYFISSEDSNEDLNASYGMGIGGTQWLNADTIENMKDESGTVTVNGVNYKFGSLKSLDSNALLLTNETTVPLSGAYLDSLYIAAAEKSGVTVNLSYVINYADGTQDSVATVPVSWWANSTETETVLVDCKRQIYRRKKVDGVETDEIERFVYNAVANIYTYKLPVTSKKRAVSITLKSNQHIAVFCLSEVYESTQTMADYINENVDCYSEITQDNKAAAEKFADYADFALSNGVTAADINNYEALTAIKENIRRIARNFYPVDLTNYFTNDYFIKSTDSNADLNASYGMGIGGTQWLNADTIENMKDESGTVTVNGVNYKFGSLDSNNSNVLLLENETTVSLRGNYIGSLYIAATEKINGNKTLNYIVNYADGTSDAVSSVSVGYWSSSETTSNVLVNCKRQIYRRKKVNGVETDEIERFVYNDVANIYTYELPVSSDKKVKSITFNTASNIGIFCLTEACETVGELADNINERLTGYDPSNIESYSIDELEALFSYIDFAKSNGVIDSDIDIEKVNALKAAFNNIKEECTPIDLSSYYEYDLFMKESDEEKSKTGFEGNETLAPGMWLESESVMNKQDENGLVSCNGVKYKFGDLTEFNKNAVGIFKFENGEKRLTREIALNGNYIDRISMLAVRKSFTADTDLKYEVVYEDGSISSGIFRLNLPGSVLEGVTPVISGSQIRYAWNDTYPGYWKVSELSTYIYVYDIPADPSKKAVNLRLSETVWQTNTFVFALTEVYPSVNTIKEGISNIPASVEELNADNIEYVRNIQGWIALAQEKNIELPDETLIAALTERAALINNNLLSENGVKSISENTVTFTADAYNFGKNDIDVYVVIAAYTDNKLTAVNMVKNTALVKNEKQTLSADLTLPSNYVGNDIKVMLWGGNMNCFADTQ